MINQVTQLGPPNNSIPPKPKDKVPPLNKLELQALNKDIKDLMVSVTQRRHNSSATLNGSATDRQSANGVSFNLYEGTQFEVRVNASRSILEPQMEQRREVGQAKYKFILPSKVAAQQMVSIRRTHQTDISKGHLNGTPQMTHQTDASQGTPPRDTSEGHIKRAPL